MNEAVSRKGTKYYICIVLFACLMNMVMYFYTTSVSLLYDGIAAELGCELTAIKLYYTLSMIAGLVASLVILKALFPKWGGRKMLIIFGLVGSVSYICLGFCNQVWQFYVLGILIGVGLQSCLVAISTIAINMWFLDKVGVFLGISAAMSGVAGMLFSKPLSRIIAVNWRNGYFLSGAFILAAVLISYFFLYRQSPKDCGVQPYGIEKYMEKAKQSAGQKNTVSGLTLNSALKTAACWLLMIGLLLYGFLLAFTQSSVGFFMEQGFTIVQAAGFLAWLSGAMIVWKPVLGWLADKLGGKWTYIIAAGIAFCGFVLQQLFGSTVAFIPNIFIICYACGISALSVLNPIIIKELFGLYEYNAILPVVGAVAGISNAVCVTLWSVIYKANNSYISCAWIAAASAIALIVFIFAAYNAAKSPKHKALIQEKEM